MIITAIARNKPQALLNSRPCYWDCWHAGTVC